MKSTEIRAGLVPDLGTFQWRACQDSKIRSCQDGVDVEPYRSGTQQRRVSGQLQLRDSVHRLPESETVGTRDRKSGVCARSRRREIGELLRLRDPEQFLLVFGLFYANRVAALFMPVRPHSNGRTDRFNRTYLL
ncbi:hypothetical protein LSH36_616g02024 [Paralvinella palmiformis]|uniref:Uncharacterized protein n=1 Tax=Paralvinella palmiformis TaxID=53620 RepID=A0AAD9IRT2_9ANNE|nr:hypothetical protein LSH36_1755g00000 [Paralvinella palmiformis]KAK2146315.1 hypothetical protein LSH36_616g02024 [Paralvinella palmiformis]